MNGTQLRSNYRRPDRRRVFLRRVFLDAGGFDYPPPVCQETVSGKGSYPPQVKTRQGPALLLAFSVDRQFALLSNAVPKEKRSKEVGPCRNHHLPISELLEEQP
jgi:hypothetical protein